MKTVKTKEAEVEQLKKAASVKDAKLQRQDLH